MCYKIKPCLEAKYVYIIILKAVNILLIGTQAHTRRIKYLHRKKICGSCVMKNLQAVHAEYRNYKIECILNFAVGYNIQTFKTVNRF